MGEGDKDPLDSILADLTEDDNDLDFESDDDKALKAEMAAKDKKIAGLLKEAKSQRKKRQDVETRLNELQDTVTNILASRQSPADDIKTQAQKVDDIIKGEYDDDGNPVIKTDALTGAVDEKTKALEEKVANLEALLQAGQQAQSAEAEGQKIINAIVGSDDRFGPAYNKYQTARKWVEDKVVEYQNENQIQGYMSSGQALDYVFDDEAEAEFRDSFPDMDLTAVVTAEDSQRHLKGMLTSIADAMSPETGTDDDGQSRVKKLMKKPSSLGSRSDQKTGQLDLLDRLKGMSPDDLMGISDAQEQQILEALRREDG